MAGWLLSVLLGMGGVYVDNPGAALRIAPPADSPAGWLGVELGVGQLHYGTVAASLLAQVELTDRSRLTLGAGWAVDYDSAGDEAAIRVHHVIGRLALEADVGERWFVSAELTPVRYPVRASGTRNGDTHDLPIGAKDGVYFRPGIAVGLRL